jgi:4-hydroxy-3-methylbut-2-enyl diphosphate reductase
VGANDEVLAAGWLPVGPVTVGLTAGASTPNNVVGEVVERILALRGRTTDDLVAVQGS